MVQELIALLEARDGLMTDLLQGPEELQLLVARCYSHPDEGWLRDAVRALRPLTRQYIARVLERHGLPLQDNDTVRAYGFFQ